MRPTGLIIGQRPCQSKRLQVLQCSEGRRCGIAIGGDEPEPYFPFIDCRFVPYGRRIVQAYGPEARDVALGKIADGNDAFSNCGSGTQEKLRGDTLAIGAFIQPGRHQHQAFLGRTRCHVKQKPLFFHAPGFDGKPSNTAALGIQKQRILPQLRRKSSLFQPGDNNKRESQAARSAHGKKIDSSPLKLPFRIEKRFNRLHHRPPHPLRRNQPRPASSPV